MKLNDLQKIPQKSMAKSELNSDCPNAPRAASLFEGEGTVSALRVHNYNAAHPSL